MKFSELKAVVAELGGPSVLGRSLRNENEMRKAIRDGFPHIVIENVMHSAGITLKELAASLGVSVRSVQRRRAGRLARHESDRLYRLARIVALAKHYIGDDQAAIRWLRKPNQALGRCTPLELMDTELGACEVENVLGRIAYGGVS